MKFDGVPAYVSLARALEDEGYWNSDEQIPAASGIRPHLVGTLDSTGTFFEELDAVVRASGDTRLAFLLFAPSKDDVRQHWERLSPPARALAESGALVLRREEFLALQSALQTTRAAASLKLMLAFVIEGPAPAPDEIDVWLSQGAEPVAIERLPDERGGPPAPRALMTVGDRFDRSVRAGLILLGIIGVVAIIWQVFF